MSVKNNNTRKPEHSGHKWLGNERGSALIMIAVCIVVLFAFAMIAIDGAILMTSRTQLHSAADAAALAGASGLLDGGQPEAIARAMDYSSYNEAVKETMAPVIINANDVSFPEQWVVRVQTHRTAATGDPLRTYFRRVVNPFTSNTADMTAVAAARAYDVCGSRCLKPWAIPDRWDDANANGAFDAGEAYDPLGTGYNAPVDVGYTIMLKAGRPSQAIEPGIYFPVNYPPIDKYPGEDPLTGGAWYREFIADCAPYVIEPGDRLQIEPGGMAGPTAQGVAELIGADPNAYWDGASKTIVNSAFGLSPRVALVPFFDPTLPPTTGRNEVTISKIGAFFIEDIDGNGSVYGRFIEITAQGLPCPGNGVGPSFLKGIVLVE